MRTTIYINTLLLKRLKNVAQAMEVSQNKLITLLLMKIINKSSLKPKMYKAVSYQESDPDIIWKIEHITLEPVFYEKDLDLRRNFKYSVSWLIAFAIINYLDEIKEELSGGNNQNTEDNYDRDFVYIYKKIKGIHHFTSILGKTDQNTLEEFTNSYKNINQTD